MPGRRNLAFNAPGLDVEIVRRFPLVDELVQPCAQQLGVDYAAYRNHIYRVLNFYQALSGSPGEIPRAVLIAAAFHDLGIWVNKTFDYLPPSVQLARDYLSNSDQLPFEPEVRALINEHHKLRPYRGAHASTVEVFRQADLVDLSLGLIRHGLPRAYVKAVMAEFPNAGFHRRLVALTARQFVRSPLRPLPMMRW